MKDTRIKMKPEDVKIYEELWEWIGVEKENLHRFEGLVIELLRAIVQRRDPTVVFRGWGYGLSVDVDQTIIISQPDAYDVEIFGNNWLAKQGCPICGVSHKDADAPYWIALKGTRDGLCERCAKQLAPAMLAEVRKRNAEEWGGLAEGVDVHDWPDEKPF